jgi:hypothetical protein
MSVNLNLDSNYWYQINVDSYPTQSLDGTPLFQEGGTGVVFLQVTNTSHFEQSWQLFPINNTYVIRSRGSGPRGYLNTAIDVNETTAGSTVPQMRNYTISDDSIYWAAGSWGDGTFFLTNRANGSDFHLGAKDNAFLSMDSNVTTSVKHPGQQFTFKRLSAINDDNFSSVVVCPTLLNTSPLRSQPC